jgi:23S rRNA pseudouridine2604 synthase
MATLKLNNKNMAGASGPGQRSRNAEGEMRAPVRGKGLSRPRQSLEKAQGERQERQTQFEQRSGGFTGQAGPGPQDVRDHRSSNSNENGHGGSNSQPRPERPRFADRHRQGSQHTSRNPGQGPRQSMNQAQGEQGQSRGAYGRPPERDARDSRDSHDSRGPQGDRGERSGGGYQGGQHQGGQHHGGSHQGGQYPQQQGARQGMGQGGGGSGGYQRDDSPRYEDRRPARNEWQPQDSRPEQRNDVRQQQPQQDQYQPRRQEGNYGRPPEHAGRDSRDARPTGPYPRNEQRPQYQQRPQFDGREAPASRDSRDSRDARGPRDDRNSGGQYPQRSQPYQARSGQGEGSGSYQQRQQQERDQQQQRPRFDDRRPAQFDSRDGQGRREPYSQQPYSQQTPQQEPRRDQRRASGPRPAGAYQPHGSNGPSGQGYPARPYQGNQGNQGKAAPRSRDEDDDDDDDDHYVDPNKAEGVRLSKHMGVLGMASRREADEWIAAGWVRVDGKLAVLGQRVGLDPTNLKIEVDQLANKEQAKRVTILMNKPIGLVSGQAEDGYENASTLIRSDTHWAEDTSGLQYHIGHSRSLAPAGRLDIDSTGLLVLTQDGRIAKLLIGEDSKIEKEYLVRVEYEGRGGVKSDTGRLPDADLELLNHGLELDGLQLKPAKVSWQNEDQLRFVLREGRKRQIRRMCEQVGLKVVGLRRVRIGRISLGNLPVGQWRFLTPWERFD